MNSIFFLSFADFFSRLFSNIFLSSFVYNITIQSFALRRFLCLYLSSCVMIVEMLMFYFSTPFLLQMRIPKLYVLMLVIMTSCFGMALGQSSSSFSSSSPYCSFSPFHTLCLHSGGLGPRCGDEVQLRGVNPQDAALILAQHNQLRSRVAIGQEGRGAPGPQPQASNMRLLVKIGRAHV